MMNRRVAYATFEKTILDLYTHNMLTRPLLDRIAGQYRFLNMDSAGSTALLTHDGKDLQQICIELIDPTFPIAARGSSEDHEEYWEKELYKWEEIVHIHWGWRAYNTIFSMQKQVEYPEKTYLNHAA